MPKQMPPQRYCIVNIHGTFASDADWPKRGSTFDSGLRMRLPNAEVATEAFTWSGGNSHADRLSAAQSLRRLILELKRKYEGYEITLIAHSHGGNVALYAMRDSWFEQAITSVVFLGTPFISCRRRTIPEYLEVLEVWLAFVAMCFVWLLLRVVGVPGWLILAANTAVFFYSYSIFERARHRVHGWIYSKQDEIVKHYQTQAVSRVPFLNVLFEEDEAYHYLAYLSFFSRVPANVHWPLSNLIGCVIGATLLSIPAIVVLPILLALGLPSQLTGEEILVVLFVIVIVSGAAILLAAVLHSSMVLIPAMMRSHRLGFGREGFLLNWLVDVSVSRSPKNPRRLQVALPISPEDRRRLGVFKGHLVHSFYYDSPEAMTKIAEWIGDTKAERTRIWGMVNSVFGYTDRDTLVQNLRRRH